MSLGFFARGLLVVLAAHAIVSTVVAMAVVLVERRVVARAPSIPRSHAGMLCLLRLAPFLAALAVAWFGVALSFVLWEPRVEAERVGPAAIAAASMGAALLLSGVWRAFRALGQAWRVHTDLRHATRSSLGALPLPAFIVETRFPVVALVGLSVPRLFLARSVLKACTTAELRTVVAHELAHARARDNVRRLAMASAPDILGWLPAGGRIQDAWAVAAELAADEAAARRPMDRLHLASALVKVARLADEPAAPLPASTLHGSEPIAQRVRRLVDPPPPVTSPRVPARLLGAALAAVAATIVLLLPAAYAAVEALVRLGVS